DLGLPWIVRPYLAIGGYRLEADARGVDAARGDAEGLNGEIAVHIVDGVVVADFAPRRGTGLRANHQIRLGAAFQRFNLAQQGAGVLPGRNRRLHPDIVSLKYKGPGTRSKNGLY